MREGLEEVKREEKRLQAAAAEYNSRQDEIVVPSKPYPVKSQPYVPRNSSSLDMPNHLSDSPLQRRDYHGNNHPAIKPADLPLNTSPSANDRFGELGRFRNVSRTPGISYREKYFERNTGPQSEPADKHNYSPLMAFGSVAYSPKREDGPLHVASTRSACAVAPTGHGSLSTTLDNGLAMKTFTKTQSEQHMTLRSTSQCNVPPHPSHIPSATADPQDLKNLDTLNNQMSQVSLNGNESSKKALPGNNMASESLTGANPSATNPMELSPQHTNSCLLSINDLGGVLETVWEARSKWYNMGLKLGTSPGTLDAIKMAAKENPDDCITAMIKGWLNKGNPRPTWAALAKALKSPMVGYDQLADNLPPRTTN